MTYWRNNRVLFLCLIGCVWFFLRNLTIFHVDECESFSTVLCKRTTTTEDQLSIPFRRMNTDKGILQEIPITSILRSLPSSGLTTDGVLNRSQNEFPVISPALINKNSSAPRDTELPLPHASTRISSPVFLASLPKSGTTSIHFFFKCGRVNSAHKYCPRWNGTIRAIGVLMERNIKNGNPPFQGCGDAVGTRGGKVQVFTDHGYVADDGRCYYPSVHSLDALYKSYPNMTLMLATRNATNWFHSLQQWNGGNLLDRWKLRCHFMLNNISSHPNSQHQFEAFYDWHTRHVRTFAQQHPSVTYLEFAIDSPTVGEYLEQQTGISADCWGHFHPNSATNLFANRTKRQKRVNKTQNTA